MFCMREHRWGKFMWGLFIVEIGPTVALLALFGIAAPDLYRSDMWQYGADQGWNSDPNQLLYAAANYEPVETPMPWSQFVTNFNLVITVFSVFVLLTKVTMHIMGILWPVISAIIHAVLVVLFAYSAYGQASPDNSDPEHPTNGPCWYITKNCSDAPGSLAGYCMQAKSAFAVTIVMIVLHTTYLVYSLVCCRYTPAAVEEYKERKAERKADKEFEKRILAEQKEAQAEAHQWELHQWPTTPGTAGAIKSPYTSPFTPRTTAFQSLGGVPEPIPSPALAPEPTPQPQPVRTGTSGSANSAGGSGSYTRELPLRQSQEGVRV